MMIRATPEQIAEGWDLVRPIIAKALPPTVAIDAESMTNVLYSLLEEESQLWIYYENNDRTNALGVVVTVIINEPVSKARYLLVYTTTAIAPTTKEDYEKGLDTLRSFAEANDCAQVIAYVENDARVRQLLAIGGVKVSTIVRL